MAAGGQGQHLATIPLADGFERVQSFRGTTLNARE
jgi:hypothetical protein